MPFDLSAPYAASDVATTQPAQADWWRRFGDAATADLVTRAMAGNFDLKAAAARVRQAEAARRQSRSARYPQLSAGFTASGRKTPERDAADFFPAGAAGGATGGTGGTAVSFDTGEDFVETYDLNLNASWQLDFFGRLRRLEEAAALDTVATRADRIALAHTLTAQVIRARVAVATLELRLRLARENVTSLRDTLEVVDSRYGAGIGDPVELRLARENVASAEAAVPPLEGELATQRFALAVLLGQRPGDLGELPETLDPLPPLDPPPVGIPASLLDRRPDLLANEFRVRAQQARIGASVAELFPDLSLTGSFGVTSDELGNLIDADSIVYSIIGSAVQPIFQGGRIRADIARNRAAAEEQAATYAGNVLTAMREVSDALVRESTRRSEAEASARALAEATSAEELARERFGQGIGNLLNVFEGERRRRAAEERLALARQGVWNARVDLHLALGGDWFDPSPATTRPTSTEGDPQ